MYKRQVEGRVALEMLRKPWKLRKKHNRDLEYGNRLWRGCCGHTLRDRIRNEAIREQIRVVCTSVIDTTEAKIMMVHGHVQRMKEERRCV